MSPGDLIDIPTRRFRWSRFSLRLLLSVMLVLSLGLAWYGRELRRQERIEHAVQLLAQSPSVYSQDPDPIAIVRAVNALQALGKTDAIFTLRQFAARYPSQGDPFTPHMSMDLVLPLLFDRMDPEDSFPPFWITARSDWDGFLYVQDDLPFRRGRVSLEGQEGDKTALINWAETHGRLRSTPLHPGDDPLAAADEAIKDWIADQALAQSPLSVDNATSEKFVTEIVRGQAWKCVAPVLGLHKVEVADDRNWRRLQDECQHRGVHWSQQLQAYVTNADRREPPSSQ